MVLRVFKSLAFLILFSRVMMPLGAQPGLGDETDEALFRQGQVLWNQGDTAGALESLRLLRVTHEKSPFYYPSMLLSARINLGLSESFKSRYFLKKVITGSLDPLLSVEACFLLGDVLMEDRVFDQAYSYYSLGTGLNDKQPPPVRIPGSRAFLRMAEVAFYNKQDRDLARNHLLRVDRKELSPGELPNLELLRKKLAWETLYPGDLGMEDGNISSLAIDGDDLWIGTWNGGVARFTTSTGEITRFNMGINSIADNAVRAIEVTQRRIWVGMYDGLSVYSRAFSAWQKVERLGEGIPGKISLIREIDGILHVGTLEQGLWKQEGEKWVPLGNRELPGKYIQSLAFDDERIYIGTMDLGLCILDRKSGIISSFDSPAMAALNITMLLKDLSGGLWIGTYGDGLYYWKAGRVTHYSRDEGSLQDDWVLCGVETPRGFYFGTFGGGAAFLDRETDSWSSLGIKEGLPSRDIATIAYSHPHVYFGTLGQGISIFEEYYE